MFSGGSQDLEPMTGCHVRSGMTAVEFSACLALPYRMPDGAADKSPACMVLSNNHVIEILTKIKILQRESARRTWMGGLELEAGLKVRDFCRLCVYHLHTLRVGKVYTIGRFRLFCPFFRMMIRIVPSCIACTICNFSYITNVKNGDND